MKKVVFITPDDSRFGFALTGAVQECVTAEEAEPALRKAVTDPDNGVVVIDERLLAGIDEEHFREMEERWYGILLVLPAPGKGAEVEDYALKLIRRAIGYHVRLQI